MTANGQAKLFFSQNNNRVEETSLDIERISNTDDLITHAAICADKSRSTGRISPFKTPPVC